MTETQPLQVLARGADWLVVAKPPWLLVHRTKGVKDSHYALQVLRDQIGQPVFPIHRLDRQTSGCLLFGLSSEGVAGLQAALAHDDAVKVYVAQVRGRWNRTDPVVVDRPIADDRGIVRDAWSEVRCLGASADPRTSLLDVRVRTGRYHQVRRHVRSLDHPVLGDSMHGDTRCNRVWREEHALPRLALHCLHLDLPHPDGPIRATSPLFEDLHRIWTRMPWWDDAVREEPALSLPPIPVPDYLGP